MLLRIQHETKLTYSEPVVETVIELRMAPPSTDEQTTLGYRLQITPPAPLTSYRDGYGNRVDLFNRLAPCCEVLVRATSYVQTHRRPGRPRLDEVRWPALQPPELEALEFLWPSRLVDRCPALTNFVRDLTPGSDSLAETVARIMEAVHRRLRYEKRVTTVRTPLSEALDLGRGVCQDFAHLMLGACRELGIPARYVSGYINQPGEIATHAWCQVWGGTQVGWVDVDPTLCQFAGANHVVIAVGRDYSDVPPNRGVWKGNAEETIAVTVKVESLERMPSDWGDPSGQLSWSATPYTQTQRLSRPASIQQQLASQRLLYRHQQCQQQQIACNTSGSI